MKSVKSFTFNLISVFQVIQNLEYSYYQAKHLNRRPKLNLRFVQYQDLRPMNKINVRARCYSKQRIQLEDQGQPINSFYSVFLPNLLIQLLKRFRMKFSMTLLFMISLFMSNCKKLVQVESPITKVDAETVYSNDANATSVLTGIYIGMNNSFGFATGTSSISVLGGLSADELVTYSGFGDQRLLAYQNRLSSTDNPGVPFWSTLYYYIYTTNSAIKGLTNSKSLTHPVKQQLLGEAKFMRAFCYFYLVNLWQDVPLVLNSDFKTTGVMARTLKTQVYEQIIEDLKEATILLNSNFVSTDLQTTTNERIRPNKWASTALLARVYLYSADYFNAEKQSTAVIDNTNLFDLVTIDNVFLKNSNEAIWQLQPIDPGWNTNEARGFILTDAPSNFQPVSISNQLMNAFEKDDKRLKSWIGSISVNGNTYFYPYKYKVNTQNAPITEYLMVLRLAEQYLIRAESRVQQGNLLGGKSDLDVIRLRAGLKNSVANDKKSLLTAIEKERQIELFSEWGHRWLDLKRTNRVDEVMSSVTPLKGGIWTSGMSLYPIPQSEILLNPALKQNPGYNN
jgi:hypothetical protein